MVRYLIPLLLLPGCAFVRFTAEIEGVGTIHKTVVAIGNTEVQEVSHKLAGSLIKKDVILQFGSESNVQAVTKEQFLNFLGGLTPLL